MGQSLFTYSNYFEIYYNKYLSKMVNLKRILQSLPLLAYSAAPHNFSSIPMAADGNATGNSEIWGLSDLDEVADEKTLFIPSGNENVLKL